MRKKTYIQQPSRKDTRLCDALRCCNHLSREQAISIVSRHRLDSYIKQGVVERLYHITKQGQKIEVYALTANGRKWIDRNITELRQHSYYCSPTAPMHNIKLAEEFLRQDRTDWLTERDLRNILADAIAERDNAAELLDDMRNGLISVPDGAYRTTDGQIECVEIINNHYGTAEIAAKDAFAEVTGLSITYIKE